MGRGDGIGGLCDKVSAGAVHDGGRWLRQAEGGSGFELQFTSGSA